MTLRVKKDDLESNTAKTANTATTGPEAYSGKNAFKSNKDIIDHSLERPKNILDSCKQILRKHMSCIIFWILAITFLLAYIFRPRYVPYFTNKDYTPQPIDWSEYDEFIAD
jgi:hypothetical protein